MNEFEEFDLPSYFKKEEDEVNSKIDKLLKTNENINQNLGYALKTSYHNGVKNYQFVKIE